MFEQQWFFLILLECNSFASVVKDLAEDIYECLLFVTLSRWIFGPDRVITISDGDLVLHLRKFDCYTYP